MTIVAAVSNYGDDLFGSSCFSEYPPHALELRSVVEPYFDALMKRRQVVSWGVATRLQLGRWEALVAENLRNELYDKVRSAGALIWQAQFEHHFCLIAARHLLRTLDMSGLPIAVDGMLRAEIVEGRDLHEHWDENMPVFNVRPRPREPGRKTGKTFAQRNPIHSPYWWLGWDNKVGPKLLPHVSAAALHALLDQVETHVLRDAPEMAAYALPRPESPWLEGWWPRPPSSETENAGPQLGVRLS